MLISCYLITAGMTGYFFALQSYNNMFKNIYTSNPQPPS